MATVSLPQHKGEALRAFPQQWQRQGTQTFSNDTFSEDANVFFFSERWKMPNELAL